MSVFKGNIQIREVWADNLEEELLNIHGIMQSFVYVGLDSDFYTESGKKFQKQSSSDGSYLQFIYDMNRISINQMGITFFDDDGDLPSSSKKHYCSWEFNFRKELNSKNGKKRVPIDPSTFGNKLKKYKIVSNNQSWVLFYGRYDIAVLLKMLTGQNLPEREEEFDEKVEQFFPAAYDLKCFTNRNKTEEIGRLNTGKYCCRKLAGWESLVNSQIFVKLTTEKDNFRKKRRSWNTIW